MYTKYQTVIAKVVRVDPIYMLCTYQRVCMPNLHYYVQHVLYVDTQGDHVIAKVVRVGPIYMVCTYRVQDVLYVDRLGDHVIAKVVRVGPIYMVCTYRVHIVYRMCSMWIDWGTMLLQRSFAWTAPFDPSATKSILCPRTGVHEKKEKKEKRQVYMKKKKTKSILCPRTGVYVCVCVHVCVCVCVCVCMICINI